MLTDEQRKLIHEKFSRDYDMTMRSVDLNPNSCEDRLFFAVAYNKELEQVRAGCPFPAQESKLMSFKGYEIINRHDDGDLTVLSQDKLYVVTTDGKLFEEK